MHDQRLTDLETRIAFLEKDSSDLNEVLVLQQRQLDTLEKQLRVVAAQLKMLRQTDQGPQGQEAPPHY